MPVASSLSTGEIPEWLKSYITGGDYTDPSTGNKVPFPGILSMATAEATKQPAPYDATVDEAIGATTNRIAAFNPLQEYAFNEASSLGPSSYLTDASGLLGLAGNRTYDANTAKQYMDPYAQMVVDQQKKTAIQDYQRQMPTLNAGAWQAGAGRGTRSALMQSEANRNLQNNLQNIQAKGLQDAWNTGLGQFNTEADRQLQAGTGLGQLGATDFSQRLGANKNRATMGASIQQQLQNILNTNYEDYLAQRREPYQKYSWLADFLSGVPVTDKTQTMFSPSTRPNTAGVIAGAGASAVGNGQ
jgi:hypothetical protein